MKTLNVQLSAGQLTKCKSALKKGNGCSLRLSPGQLNGGEHAIGISELDAQRLQKALDKGKGSTVNATLPEGGDVQTGSGFIAPYLAAKYADRTIEHKGSNIKGDATKVFKSGKKLFGFGLDPIGSGLDPIGSGLDPIGGGVNMSTVGAALDVIEGAMKGMTKETREAVSSQLGLGVTSTNDEQFNQKDADLRLGY